MTENRTAELYTGLNAFRALMIEASGDLGAMAEALDLEAKTMRACGYGELAVSLIQKASMARSIALHFTDGIDRLTRLADGSMEETMPIDFREIAASNADDED